VSDERNADPRLTAKLADASQRRSMKELPNSRTFKCDPGSRFGWKPDLDSVSNAALLGGLAILLFATAPAHAAKPHYELTGKVVKIADGDTLTILDGSNEQHRIRLAGIDAPEKGNRSAPRPGRH
jgi:hypothetical protein